MKFGAVYPGQTIPAIYNNLMRAPLFRHKPYATDFLVVRSVFLLVNPAARSIRVQEYHQRRHQVFHTRNQAPFRLWANISGHRSSWATFPQNYEYDKIPTADNCVQAATEKCWRASQDLSTNEVFPRPERAANAAETEGGSFRYLVFIHSNNLIF